jgi:hypothetical protein
MWEGFTINHVVDVVVFSHFCKKVVMLMQKEQHKNNNVRRKGKQNKKTQPM